MGLREIIRLEVVDGRWKEFRQFVEVENPENRPISKIKKEDKDLVPLSPSDLTDAKTWYDSSTEANKKHILTDAGISEDVSKIPDSQELPKELQDKVGEDYDYLTDSEKISRLRAFGVEVRRKFPSDSFDELSEDEQNKLLILFEQEQKIPPAEQWPTISVPDPVFPSFEDVIKRYQEKTPMRLIGEIRRFTLGGVPLTGDEWRGGQTPYWNDRVRIILKKIGATSIQFQKIGIWEQAFTATLKNPDDVDTLYQQLEKILPQQFVIEFENRDRGEIIITNISGEIHVPVNPIYYERLLQSANELIWAWQGETGQLPALPEPEIDPRQVRGAVVANEETEERGVVRTASGKNVTVMVISAAGIPTGQSKEWTLSKIKLLREGQQ